MKKIFIILMMALTAASCSIGSKYDWEENFDGDTFNPAVWSKVRRGTPDWNRHMSDYDPLYEVSDGVLTLHGIVNPGIKGDDSPVITGGLQTKGKVGFGYGKIEIRAKLKGARSAWPAIWLMPFDKIAWPKGGEIDIMERLNFDDIVYTTCHSTFTKREKKLKHSSTAKIDPDGWNVYGLAHYPDKLVWSINGEDTYTYVKMEDAPEDQWPFDREYYLILSMQLGGEWVGPVSTEDLPTDMQIDWIRFKKY